MTAAMPIIFIACSMQIDDAKTKEMPPVVKRYFEESDRQRQAKIAEIESEISERLAKAKQRKSTKPADKKKQGEEIAAMKKSVESLKKNTQHYVPSIDPATFQVGQVGVVSLNPGYSGMVLAVPGSRNYTSLPGRSSTELRVSQIINAKEMIVDTVWYSGKPPREQFGKPFWVKGIETDAYTSDAELTLDGVFHVSGTTSYNTVGAGKQTVFVLQLVDVNPWLKSGR